MNYINKIISVILAVSILSTMSIGYATDVKYLPNDYDIGVYTDNIESIRDKIRNFTDFKQVFSDIGINSEYYEAASALYSTGIISGYADKTFKPDNNIKARDLCSILFNIADSVGYKYELANNSNTQDIIFNEADKLDLAELKSVIMISGIESDVFLRDALNISFKALGIRVFNNSLYDLENPDNLLDITTRVAKEYRIIGDTSGYITRGQAINLIYKLLTTDINSKIPDIANRINIDYENDIYDLGNVYIEITKIPDVILDAFNNYGWELEIGDEYINNYNERNSINAIGLCDSSLKKLYISNDSAVIHEFGHFLQKHTLYPFEIARLYENEADKLASITRDYCKKNSTEYFAEAFDLYIKCINDNTMAEKFKAKAPLTWEYFRNLDNNNWEIVW